MNNVTQLEKMDGNRLTITEENAKGEPNIYTFQPTDESVTADEVISVIESIYDATRNRSEYKRLSGEFSRKCDDVMLTSSGPEFDPTKISSKAKSILGNISLEDLRNSNDDDNYTPRGSIISRRNSGRSLSHSTSLLEEPVKSVEEALAAELTLSQEDWDLILQGAEYATYMKDMKVDIHFYNEYIIITI